MNLESTTSSTPAFPAGIFAAEGLRLPTETEDTLEETEEVTDAELVKDDEEGSDKGEENEAA